MSLIQLPLDREVRVRVTPKDAGGDRVTLGAPAVWVSSSPDIVEVVDVEPTQGLAATLVPRARGHAIILVRGLVRDGFIEIASLSVEVGEEADGEADAYRAFDVTTEPSRARRA